MRYLPCDRGDSYSLEITAGMKQEDIKDNYTNPVILTTCTK